MVKRLRDPGYGPFVGIDQSARGTAAVAIVDGKMAGLFFYADTKTKAAEIRKSLDSKDITVLDPIEVKAADEWGRVERLAHLRGCLRAFLRRWNPVNAALEDYALSRKAFVHFLGEVGGVVRLEFRAAEIPFRAYDVQAVKMFATGRGDAEKADMVLACRDRWEGLNFLEYGKTEKAAGNVADAYVIAQLLRTEILIRAGVVKLEDIREEERRTFLRTTKQRPVNILDTPFAVRAS